MSAAEPPRVRRRHIAAAVAGNALEFYDFTVYTFFSIQIGQAFFPSHDPFVSLMLSLGTFGAGFLGRPVGGLVIGMYADRRGRRPALVLSFVLMGVGVLGLGLTPSYAAIGLAAPLIVIAARIVQGVALGGQVGSATAYLLEIAPPERRGFYTTLQYGSQGFAAILGGFVAFMLARLLNVEDLAAYGWRIAFLLGAAALPFGFVLQRSLPETLPPQAARTTESIGAHVRAAVLALFALGSATIGVYTLYYLPTYAQRVLGMHAAVASATGMIFGVCNLVFAVWFGSLSDRFGRRWTAIWPRIAAAAVTLPLFMWLVAERSTFSLLAITAILTVFVASSAGANLPAIAESMPAALRSGVLGTVYAVAIALFGGTAEALEHWLVHVTGSPFAPAWYLVAASLMGVAAIWLMPETAPAKTKPRQAEP
ncbi:MAG: MFS transporter [Rhizomicrobium sp.]